MYGFFIEKNKSSVYRFANNSKRSRDLLKPPSPQIDVRTRSHDSVISLREKKEN